MPMPQDVYVDLLFLINFSMDYICLYITVKILHQKIRLSRMIVASVLGGAYSVAALFLPISPSVELALDGAVCILMCFISFAQKGRAITRVLLYGFLFVGVSMMLGGCMTAIFNLLSKIDLPLEDIFADSSSTYIFAILAAIAGIISLKSGQIISRRSAARKCHLEIAFCGKSFDFQGLCDSGNLVRDPISHKPVIFVDRSVLEKQLDLSFIDEYSKGILLPNSPCKNLRLIIISTASGRSTLVAALPQSVILVPDHPQKHSKEPIRITLDCLIAPTQIDKNPDEYNAIVPLEIVKEM